jgi:MFS family permease
VFFLAAALAVPALVALRRIRPGEIDPVRARGGVPLPHPHTMKARLHGIADNKPLLIFGACLVLFHLANGAMLPLMASVVTMRSSEWATVLIAACIVAPQLLVALVSPWIGRRAETWGRWPLLLTGFAALAIRGVFFIFVRSPYLLVAVQLLDGVSAAVMGVMLPLVVADTTRGTGHFNAALGVVGTAGAIGASLSTTLAGYASDTFGNATAFSCLAAIAVASALMVAGLMPETRPERA